MNKNYIIGALFYLGAGFLVHWVFLGATLDWNSAATFGVVILWPLYLVWQFIIVVFWIIGIAVACFLIYCAYCVITGRSI